MRIYIAGPMRGIPEFNFPAFDEATAWLRARGHDVFNPAERDRDEDGFTGEGFDGTEDLSQHGFDLRAALGADLAWITEHADLVVVLPGWEESKGANAEVATAVALGIPFRRYDTMRNTTRYLVGDVGDRMTESLDETRTTSPTGGQKGRKPLEVGAVDPMARAELGRVAAYGSAKYERGNYLRGYDWSLNVDALHRHMLAFEAGEDRDPESGCLHTAHAAWHGLALASFVLRDIGTDDRTVAP